MSGFPLSLPLSIPPYSFLSLTPVSPDVTADSVDIVLVPLGSELHTSCSMVGIPPPDMVTWRHNGSVLLTSDPLITVETSTTSTSLTRRDIAKDGGGTYECEASNGLGSTTANITVTVQCKYVIGGNKVKEVDSHVSICQCNTTYKKHPMHDPFI